eukprot:3800941-Amphidinium_carterae.1
MTLVVQFVDNTKACLTSLDADCADGVPGRLLILRPFGKVSVSKDEDVAIGKAKAQLADNTRAMGLQLQPPRCTQQHFRLPTRS